MSPIIGKLHSILAHARFVGQEMRSLSRVVVHMEWRGLSGRSLGYDEHHAASPTRVADDRFVKTVSLEWNEIRDSYFNALRKICLPIFSLFASYGWLEPPTWFTKELVERELKRYGDRMRLFKE